MKWKPWSISLAKKKKKKGKALKIRKKIIYTLSVEEFWFPFHISYLIMMKSKYILLFISVKSRPSQRPPASCKVKSEMFAARAGPALVGTRLNIRWEGPSTNSATAIGSGKSWKAEDKY